MAKRQAERFRFDQVRPKKKLPWPKMQEKWVGYNTVSK